MWMPAPSEIDRSALYRFLEQQGIETWQRELLVQDVVNAVFKFGTHPKRRPLRSDLAKVLKAAKRLQKTLPPLGTNGFCYLYSEYMRLLPVPPPSHKPNERDRALAFYNLGFELQKVIDGATDVLKNLSANNGRPLEPERIFVASLAHAWVERTGQRPTYSGEMCFDAPAPDFGKFVKISSEMIAAPKDFESGFADLIRRAVGGGHN
jgi:hypothetical protein